MPCTLPLQTHTNPTQIPKRTSHACCVPRLRNGARCGEETAPGTAGGVPSCWRAQPCVWAKQGYYYLC